MNKKDGSIKIYLISLMRVFFLLFVALVFPRFFFTHDKTISHGPSSKNIDTHNFKLGLENISAGFLRSLKLADTNTSSIGLITNHTGLDQEGRRNIDLLLAQGLQIKNIYVPEDDFCTYKKGNNWQMCDDQTKIPIVMLPHIDSLKKSKEYAFGDTDILFFDLQDTGMSPHAYLSTLTKTLQSAAMQNKTVVVLDRPNILGSCMEGVIAENMNSAQDVIPVPMRYGMTIGEMARYINTSLLRKSARLYVVPMQNYNRSLFADAAPLSHASLLTNIDAYYGSSFLTVLSSVQPFDIGVGTDMAFQCLTLPESLRFSKQKWFEVRGLLKEHGIETSACRYYNNKKKMYYSGLRLMVRNIEQFSPFNTIVAIVNFFKNANVALSFCPEFDRAFGGKKVREFLEGKLSRHDLEHEVNKGLKNFFNKAQNSFIYKPLPKITLL